MQVDISTKNIQLNETLRTFVNEKMADLEHLIGSAGPSSVRIEIGIPSAHHQSGPVYYAEANLTIGGHLLRAEATDYDLHAAIVDIKDKLKVEIKRFKERLTQKDRRPIQE